MYSKFLFDARSSILEFYTRKAIWDLNFSVPHLQLLSYTAAQNNQSSTNGTDKFLILCQVPLSEHMKRVDSKQQEGGCQALIFPRVMQFDQHCRLEKSRDRSVLIRIF